MTLSGRARRLIASHRRKSGPKTLGSIKNLDPFLALQIYSYALKAHRHFTELNGEAVQNYCLWTLSEEQKLGIAKGLKAQVRRETRKKSSLKGLPSTESAEESLSDLIDECHDSDSFLHALNRLKKLKKTTPSQIEALLTKALKKNFSQAKRQSTKNSFFLPRLQALVDMLKLTKLETEIIVMLFIKDTVKAADSLFDTDEFNFSMPSSSLPAMSLFFGAPSTEIGKILGSKSRLAESGVIRIKHRYSSDSLKLTPTVQECLSGLSSGNIAANILDILSPRSELGLQDFSIKKEVMETLVDLLRSPEPVSILFVGAPGTGKTELAKALAEHLQRKLISLKQNDKNGDDNIESRKLGLSVCQHILPTKDALVLVDESDALLNTKSSFFSLEDRSNDEKAWINGYLDQNKMKMIWISNEGERIEDSTKRRFSMLVEFKELSQKDRKRAWQLLVKRHKLEHLVDEDLSESLAERYTLSPGSCALALRDTKGFPRSSQLERLYTILDQKNRFIHKKAPKMASTSRRYDVGALNSSSDLTQVCSRVGKFLEARSPDFPNYNILLMGPPGTGKTEFTKYLSDTLNRELVVKKSSDLLSMWVGGTEKNIAEAFREAEDKEAILFLDEADSLFNNREQAQRSWEVTQTNELLTQMENFRGVLVCATNFDQNLDPASIRRFAQKVTFDYLKPEAILKLFTLYFASRSKGILLTEEQRLRLMQLQHLTPGDFKVVGQQFYFSEAPSTEALVSALEEESKTKKRYGVRCEIRIV